MNSNNVVLGDVAEFVRGINFKPEDVVSPTTAGAVACLRTKNVQAELDRVDVWGVDQRFVKRADQFVSSGDILVSSANSWNLVGKCCWIPELPWKTTFGGFVSVLRANRERIDPKYLYRWFSSDRTQATVRSFGQQTTNISNLNTARCLSLPLILPALPDQMRIAALLDRVDMLRAKRRATLALLESLTSAIFVEMFGDPVENPHGWPRRTLAELLSNIDSGWSPICLDRQVDGDEWGVLKLGAVTRCEFDPSENKALPLNLKPRSDLEVKTGNLLFVRKNTYQLVGACALVRETPPRLLMSDLIFRLVLEPAAPVDSHYLHQLLIYPTKRRQIQQLAGGSAGSMPNISKGRLGAALIELPPMEIQLEFAARIRALEQMRAAQRHSMSQMDELFASLQHQAFNGEL